MSLLRTLPEDFLYGLLPPGVTEEDLRGVMRALVGGFQDRVGDLRAAANLYPELYNPNSALPETADNVLVVKKLGSSETSYISSSRLEEISEISSGQVEFGISYAVVGGAKITYAGVEVKAGETFDGKDGYPDFDADGGEKVFKKDGLYTFVSGELGVGASDILSVNIGTDSRSLVQAYALQHLADTVGASLYGDDLDQQRLTLSSYFPRLKIKGTEDSYQVLGMLVGFDGVKFTPLWGRVSPRRPDDLGHVENEMDFDASPEVMPRVPASREYDPWDLASGAFFSWPPVDKQIPISDDVEQSDFYTQVVNGNNPYVAVEHIGMIESIALDGITATVTTTADHGLASGSYVRISGALQAQYNGRFEVSVTSNKTFTVTVLGSPDSPATGRILWAAHPRLSGPISSLAVGSSGLAATAATSTPHGLTTGSLVTIAGATPSQYNGTFAVEVTGPNTFRYVLLSDPDDVGSGSPVWSCESVSYSLSGGAPHRKAEVSIPGTGLVFRAIVEGESFNGLQLRFSASVDGHALLNILYRLSSVKYRSSFFDLSLVIELGNFRKRYPDVSVSANQDLKDNPNLTGQTAIPPFRPWSGGSSVPSFDLSDGYVRPVVGYAEVPDSRVQASEGTRELSTGELGGLGTQVAPFFDELRVATRFRRKFAVGVEVSDDVGFAPHDRQLLLFTAASGSFSGSVAASMPVPPMRGEVAVVELVTDTVTRGVPSQRFSLKTSKVPVIPGTVKIYDGATLVTVDDPSDDETGELVPVSGKVVSGRVNYKTGEVEFETNLSFSNLSLLVKFKRYEFLGSEVDAEADSLIHFGSDQGQLIQVLSGSVNFSTGDWSFSISSVDSSWFGLDVVLVWRANSTEVVRNEPSDADKSEVKVTYQDRPEDEIGATEIVQLFDDVLLKKPVVAGGEIVDKDTYRGNGVEVMEDITRELSVQDHNGVEYGIMGHDPTADFPQHPILVEFFERTSAGRTAVATADFERWDSGKTYSAYVVGDSPTEDTHVIWRGKSYYSTGSGSGNEPSPDSTHWNLTRPLIYHVGICHGVLVADPARFFSKAHRDGLVSWLAFNEHPRDDLKVTDRAGGSVQSLSNVLPTDRVFVDDHGWSLLIRQASSVVSSVQRRLSDKVSCSFWLSAGSSLPGSSGYDTVVEYGPLSFKLGNSADELKLCWKVESTSQDLATLSLLAGMNFISVSRSGNLLLVRQGQLGSDLSSESSITPSPGQSFDNFTHDDGLVIVRAVRRRFEISDLRIWGVSKTLEEANSVRRPRITPTVVEYLPPVFKTAGNEAEYSLKVLKSGFVVSGKGDDDRFSPVFSGGTQTKQFKLRIGQALSRVTRYDDSGAYIGEDRLKSVGLAGGQNIADSTGGLGVSTWKLGYFFYRMLGCGRVLISPSWKWDWFNQAWDGVGGEPTLEAWSVGRDFCWIHGGGWVTQNSHVYKASADTGTLVLKVEKCGFQRPLEDLKRISSTPEFSQPAGGLRYTPAEKGSLLFAEERSASMSLIADGSSYVGVHEVNGVPVAYVEGSSSILTQPVYLYAHSKLVVDAGADEVYRRWDDKNADVRVAQLDRNGVLGFTNNFDGTEDLPAGPVKVDSGRYRVTIDAGNIGELDPEFDGFDVELTVGAAVVPLTLVPGKVDLSHEPAHVIAAVGDYGRYPEDLGSPPGSFNSAGVAALIKSWLPNDFLGLGDGVYGSPPDLDEIFHATGVNYHSLIYPYRTELDPNGLPGAGDGVNRMWPIPGNHDWGWYPNPSGLDDYYAFWQGIPGNKRYYDLVRGDVHIISLDSDQNEPDGNTAGSDQAQWCKAVLASSTARWKIVRFHHGPFSTTAVDHNCHWMRWPFKEWGATMVLSGNSHAYERYEVDGLTYVIAGTGGSAIVNFGASAWNSGTAYTSTSIVSYGGRHYSARQASTNKVPSENPDYWALRLVGFDAASPGRDVALDGSVVTSTFGAVKMTSTPSRLMVEFINVDGQVLDQFEFNVARAKTSVELDIPAPIVGSPWPIQIRWTNHVDLSSQGYRRNLAIYGYKVEHVESSVYKASISGSDVVVEEVVLDRDPESLTQGAWLVGFDSNGLPRNFVHETEEFSWDDTSPPMASVSNTLTGTTIERDENLIWVGPNPPTIPDPTPPTAVALGALTASPSKVLYQVDDVVDLEVVVSAGSSVSFTWTLLDGSTVTTTENHLDGVKIGVGGTGTFRVVAVDLLGNSDEAELEVDVNPAPVFKVISVSVNDSITPYHTALYAETYDAGDTITWYDGTHESDPVIATPSNFVVASSHSVLVVATNAGGGKTSVEVELRGLSNQPPVVTAYSSAVQGGLYQRLVRVGSGRKIYLYGFASDVDQVGSLSYEWDVWGTVITGNMVGIGGQNYKVSPDDNPDLVIDISGEIPGVRHVTFTVTDGSNASSQVSFEVEFVVNQPPVINSVKVYRYGTSEEVSIVPAGTRLTYETNSSDPENDPLSFSWNLVGVRPTAVGQRINVETAFDVSDSSVVASTTETILLSTTPIVPGSVLVYSSGQTAASDDGNGTIRPGDAVTGGSVDYSTGALLLTTLVPGTVTIKYRAYSRSITGWLTAVDSYGGSTTRVVPKVDVIFGAVITSALYVETLVNSPFAYTIESTALQPTYSVSGLPDGLSLSVNKISGVPTTVGTYSVELSMTSSQGSDQRVLTVNVISPQNLRPYAPLNLRAFDDGVNPRYYSTTQAIEFRWSIADDPRDPLGLNMPSTRLEFRTLSDELKDSEEVEPGIDNFSYPVSRLVSKFGSMPTIVVRAYHKRGTLASSSYDKLAVIKV